MNASPMLRSGTSHGLPLVRSRAAGLLLRLRLGE